MDVEGFAGFLEGEERVEDVRGELFFSGVALDELLLLYSNVDVGNAETFLRRSGEGREAFTDAFDEIHVFDDCRAVLRLVYGRGAKY